MRTTSRTLRATAIALGAAAALGALAGCNDAKTTADSGSTSGATHVIATVTPPDFTGEWRLDPSRSDLPQWRGGRGGGGFGGGGGMGGGRRGGGGGTGRGGVRGEFGGRPRGSGDAGDAGDGQRPVRLPALFHVTQTAKIVSFEDSTGAVVQEIATVPAAADTFDRAPGALHLLGAWNGATLELTREGRNGAKRVETWSLADNGATLVSEIKLQGDERTDRSIKRVYRRVSEP